METKVISTRVGDVPGQTYFDWCKNDPVRLYYEDDTRCPENSEGFRAVVDYMNKNGDMFSRAMLFEPIMTNHPAPGDMAITHLRGGSLFARPQRAFVYEVISSVPSDK